MVFRGNWRERSVAVKVICCERQHAEQVSSEVKLMMSDACRHPHLLRALACMSRTRIVNSKLNQVWGAGRAGAGVGRGGRQGWRELGGAGGSWGELGRAGEGAPTMRPYTIAN